MTSIRFGIVFIDLFDCQMGKEQRGAFIEIDQVFGFVSLNLAFLLLVLVDDDPRDFLLSQSKRKGRSIWFSFRNQFHLWNSSFVDGTNKFDCLSKGDESTLIVELNERPF